MVHDRIPRCLYEHPVVEYIPLEVATVATGPIPPAKRAAGVGERPEFYALTDRAVWNAALAAHRYAFPDPSVLGPPDTLPSSRPTIPFLAVGFRVAAAIYRACKVSLAVGAVGPVYQLFTLPVKYFYKTNIDFAAYSPSGALLAEIRSVAAGPRFRRSPGQAR